MSKKYVTFGEIMLRLRSQELYRLFQTPSLEATFGGGEANVAVSLSIFGEKAVFVTALPDNAVGEAAERELMKYGVDTSAINKVKGSRLGIYFLETGANQRPSLVVYDRANSAIAEAVPADFNFDEILNGADWFHTTGITPAISQGAADCALAAMKAAKKAGATVSIDLNYRKKLWNYGKKAPEVMRELVKYADVVIADNKGIQDYVKKEYRKDSVLIAYGGDHVLREDIDSNFETKVLERFSLTPNNYAITVCRIEPENNCHYILEAFSQLDKKLLFIGNWDRHNGNWGFYTT